MNAELQQYITVASIEPLDHENIKAVASVRLGLLTIHRIRVFAKRDGGLWVAMPKEKLGEDYVPVVEFKSRELTHAISSVVLDAYKRETSPQRTLQLLQEGGSEREEAVLPQYPRKATTKSPANGKHAKRVIYGETELQNEDISDVGA